MKLSIIILIIFIIILIISKSNFNIFSNFSNIKQSNGINNAYTIGNINNIEFILYYTTPSYYSANQHTDDLMLTSSQKAFGPIPLLWLIDATNCPADPVDGTKATTIHNLTQFRYPSISSLINTPAAQVTTSSPTPGATNFTTSTTKGGSISSSVLNLINIQTLIGPTSTANIRANNGGSVTITSNDVICTIPKGNTIVTTPLVINRTYVLGVSLMNKVELPISAPSSVWQGSKHINSGIIYYYTPFIFNDFVIIDGMVNVAIGLPPSAISLNYGQL